MNTKEFVEYARLVIEEEFVSQKQFAEHAGLSEQFVCDVLKGRRMPADRFANALGFKRVVVYVKENSDGLPNN